MHQRKIFIFLLQFVALSASSTVRASGSLCQNNEKVIFSCPVGHSKIVSICASGSMTNGGFVQYRFGQKNKAELTIPSSPKNEGGITIDGNSGGNRSGGSFIRFQNGSYSYVVLNLYSMPSDPETGCNGKPCEQIGVHVEKAGKVISRLNCQGTIGSEISDFPSNYLDVYGIPRSNNYWPE